MVKSLQSKTWFISIGCSSNKPPYTDVPNANDGVEPKAAIFGGKAPHFQDYLQILRTSFCITIYFFRYNPKFSKIFITYQKMEKRKQKVTKIFLLIPKCIEKNHLSLLIRCTYLHPLQCNIYFSHARSIHCSVKTTDRLLKIYLFFFT